MDHSIKKKPEKPRMRRIRVTTRVTTGFEWCGWECMGGGTTVYSKAGQQAYIDWERTRAALNKHEGK